MKATIKKFIASLLESQAKRLLARHNPIVVAVTGSVGKTSTKLAIARVLSKKFSVLVHEGNYNSEIGLPLSLFEEKVPDSLTNLFSWIEIFWRNEQKIARAYPYNLIVLEMGADHPGDIAHFVSYITPDVGVLTAASMAHTEGFKDVGAVLNEKWNLPAASKYALLNGDDDGIREKSKTLAVPHSLYGLSEGDYYLLNLQFSEKLKRFRGTMRLKEGELSLELPTIAEHSLYALITAAAVGEHFGVPNEDVKDAIESWQQPPGRMNVLEGVEGSVLIDDSYNSSPLAARAALHTLEYFPNHKKIAILGSMNELGHLEEEGHREVGRACAELDLLVTIGESAEKYLLDEAKARGLDAEKTKACSSPTEAGKFMKEYLETSGPAVVLIKGSQNRVFAEEATKQLLSNPKDRKNLVRQTPAWIRTKKKQFPEITI